MKRKTKATLVGTAVALALLAAWIVRAPMTPRPLARAPDIDPPAMAARKKTAVALAQMPADPWTFAQSLASSAPASATEGAASERCGIEDGPQFRKQDSTEDAPFQTRAALPRYLNAQARIDDVLRRSADPLDRAVADFVNSGDLRTEAGSDEAVVQQAAVSADPRVFSLGYAICQRAGARAAGCDALTAARWAQVDPGNGMPWIELLGQARSRGDAAGVAQAMAALAAATHFDERFFDIPGAVVRALPAADPDLAAGGDLVRRAMGRAAALPFPQFKPLLDSCRNEAGGDEQRARQCVAISDTLHARSDTLLPYVMSGVLLQQTTGDPSRRELIRAERQVLAAHWSPATGLSACGTVRDEMRKLRRNAEVGEVEAMREEARKFVAP